MRPRESWTHRAHVELQEALPFWVHPNTPARMYSAHVLGLTVRLKLSRAHTNHR
jgi:hypothetical protein